MPKYVAKFELTTIDRSVAPKSEELDSEVEDAIEGIDIEGMEVNVNTVNVERAELAGEKGKLEIMASFAKEIQRTLKNSVDLEAPWADNPKYTIRQMMNYWLDKLQGKEIKE